MRAGLLITLAGALCLAHQTAQADPYDPLISTGRISLQPALRMDLLPEIHRDLDEGWTYTGTTHGYLTPMPVLVPYRTLAPPVSMPVLPVVTRPCACTCR